MPRQDLDQIKISQNAVDPREPSGITCSNDEARQEAGDVPSKEGRSSMEEKPKRKDSPSFPLKSGNGEIDPVAAKFFEEGLRNLLESYPKHFHALKDIIDGKMETVDRSVALDLRDWLYLNKDFSPKQNVAAVLKAALVSVPDGLAIVNCFDLKNQSDADVLDDMERYRESMRETQTRKLVELVLKKKGDQPGDKRSR